MAAKALAFFVSSELSCRFDSKWSVSPIPAKVRASTVKCFAPDSSSPSASAGDPGSSHSLVFFSLFNVESLLCSKNFEPNCFSCTFNFLVIKSFSLRMWFFQMLTNLKIKGLYNCHEADSQFYSLLAHLKYLRILISRDMLRSILFSSVCSNSVL